MKTYTHFIVLFLAMFFSCKAPLEVVSNSTTQYKIEQAEEDTLSAIEKLLKPYRDSLNKNMNEVIGYAEGDFIKERPSGSLGNLVVDAMFEKAKMLVPGTKGAICNFGGIRIPEIKKGSITVGKIFELLPFENELVIIEMNEGVLSKWFQLIQGIGGWPIARGYPYEIVEVDDGGGPGILSYKTIEHVFKGDSVYYFATNDYIANGGDNCEFLKGCKRINTGILIRDLMIDYIKMRKTLKPDNEQRMKF